MIGVRFVAAGSLVGAALGALSGAPSGGASVTELIGGSAIAGIVAQAEPTTHTFQISIAATVLADETRPGRGASLPPSWHGGSITGPSISRIDIDIDGSVRFAGFGTPGMRVTLRTANAALGSTVVSDAGEWRLDVDRRLGVGVHRIEAEANGGGRGAAPIPGSDVRIAIPAEFESGPVVAYERDAADVERERAAREAERRERAERLAEAATERFSELTREAAGRAEGESGRARPDRVADAGAGKPAAAPAADAQPAGDIGSVISERLDGALFWLQEWLARANREYQREVVRRLQVPAPADAPVGVEVATPPVPPPSPVRGGKPADGPVTTRADMGDATASDDRRLEDELRLARERVEAERRAAERAARERAERDAEARAAAEDAERRRIENERARLAAEQERQERLAAAERAAADRAAADRAAAERAAAERAAADRAAADRAAAERAAAERAAAERAAADRAAAKAERDRREAAILAEEIAEKRRRAALQATAPPAPVRQPSAVRSPSSAPADAQSDIPDPVRRPSPPEPRRFTAEPRLPVGADRAPQRQAEAASPPDPVRRPPPVSAPAPREAPPTAQGDADGMVDWSGSRPVSFASGVRADQRCRRSAGRRISPPGTYTVASGDSLWRIAARHYRRGALYPVIVRANSRRISDPDLIYPCQRFRLPRVARRR